MIHPTITKILETTIGEGGDEEMEDTLQSPPAQSRKGEVFIGTKLIRAYPMSEHEHLRDVGKSHHIHTDEPDSQGFRVIYEDGYKSWSPKATFEHTYRPVTTLEKALF